MIVSYVLLLFSDCKFSALEMIIAAHLSYSRQHAASGEKREETEPLLSRGLQSSRVEQRETGRHCGKQETGTQRIRQVIREGAELIWSCRSRSCLGVGS